METITITKTKVEKILTGELSEDDFPKVDELLKSLSHDLESGRISRNEIQAINRSFGEEFLNNTIQGFGIRKPFGYAGDFLMIDKIYTFHKSPIKKYAIWDKYFHSHAAPRAVRNRKAYFKEVLKSKIKSSPELSLLNIASGPARDLFELYDEIEGEHTLRTTCIEMDKYAIAYARQLIRKYADKVTFIQKNIFRHSEKNKYDVIWSAGLFDYFNNKTFIALLRRMKNWLQPGGEIIIGNFNKEHNPSRAYMEIFGEWYLYHRSSSQLKALAKEAGFKAHEIRIGKEPLQVNLFLHLSPSKV